MKWIKEMRKLSPFSKAAISVCVVPFLCLVVLCAILPYGPNLRSLGQIYTLIVKVFMLFSIFYFVIKISKED